MLIGSGSRARVLLDIGSNGPSSGLPYLKLSLDLMALVKTQQIPENLLKTIIQTWEDYQSQA